MFGSPKRSTFRERLFDKEIIRAGIRLYQRFRATVFDGPPFCRGVRFVQVTHSDQKVQVDQHGNLRAGHAERAAQVDLPIAGLLSDLKARGMLDDTLVVLGWREFGRTPTVQGPKMDGRDHNPHGFTILTAGGA